MAMRCPICSLQFEQRLQCPRCSVSLVPDEGSEAPLVNPLRPHWSRNAWGRTALGVLLSQGLFYGLYQFFLAGALAAKDTDGESNYNLYGMLALQGFQFLALLAGSLLAGAGQKSGMFYGAAVGVWNGILTATWQNLQGEEVTAVGFYGLPVLHCAFGAFGGMVGSWFWKPLTIYAPREKRLGGGLRKRQLLFQFTRGHVNWFRVLAGAAVAVGGVIWAESILSMVMKVNGARFSIRTATHQWLLTMEISGAAVLIGGAVAGAGTWYGGLQGAWAGIIGATSLFGIALGFQRMPETSVAIMLAGGILGLSLIGGWFGSRLLPPVVARSKRKFHALPA